MQSAIMMQASGSRAGPKIGVAVVERRASAGIALSLLRNEARTLEVLAGLNVPARLGFTREGGDFVLRRAHVPGVPLGELPQQLWADLLADVRESLALVHARGLIHGDLKPGNLIGGHAGLTPIDWEHALPIGAPIADLPLRAFSPGTSDPRLIWGSGVVCPDLDFYSIRRMEQWVH